MLTAGLIRQESAYDPEAHSHANAMGLMQLLPKTARRFAKQAKVRYSTPMLFEPDYNIHLGTIYFAGLQRDFGSVESALAAYNAGEERVAFWTTRPELSRAGGICGFHSFHGNARVRGNRYAQRGYLS